MITAEDFKAAFRCHPSGVALITADSGGAPVALTASSVSAVSADPALVMFSVSVLSSSAPVLRLADTLVVHLLSAKNLDLAQLGAASGVDRFADRTLWSRLATGEPVFDAARAWLRVRVLHRLDAGGSTVFVGEVLDARIDTDAAAEDGLVYADRTWHRIGEQSVAVVPQLAGASSR